MTNYLRSPTGTPRSLSVLDSQIAAYDELHSRCPVAHSELLGLSVLRHDDAVRVLDEPEAASNAVSKRLTVPKGMDGAEHTEFRRVNDRYFTADFMAAFEPHGRRIAASLVDSFPRAAARDFMADVAEVYALRVQSAFLGWPAELEEPLRRWTLKNRGATLAQVRPAMAAITVEVDGFIRDLLTVWRHAGDAARDDITTRLLGERVWDQTMTDDEIVSLLRNWTVGELSTISASVGILAYYLATHPETQRQFRNDPLLIGAANDEIRRLHAPPIANRRVTTRPVELGGHLLDCGEPVTAIWASADRDEAVFGDPDEFRLHRDPTDSLLYGRGLRCAQVHRWPASNSASSSRSYWDVPRTWLWSLAPGATSPRTHYPGSGFSRLSLAMT